MKDNIKIIIRNIVLVALTFFVCFYEFPYYIDAPGGLDNLNEKVKIEDAYKAEGSINLTYVSEYRATIPFLIIAYFHPDWEIVSKEDSNMGTLDYDALMTRQQILMRQSYTSAIKYAYEAAGKEVKVEEEKCYVIYLFEEANTNLIVGDQITSIDGTKIKKCNDINEVISSKKEGEKSSIKVLNDKKEYDRYVEYTNLDGKLVIGIQLGTEYVLETEPKYELEFDPNEYGPSGGLMISLAVYNSLVETDITGGKKIAGTGTLEPDGTVGEIGGIDYKLKGAVRNKADIFFAPSGENYKEATKLKEKRGYDIEIVEVKKFTDALEYLENNVVKK